MNENVRIIRPEKIEHAWTICKKVNKKGKKLYAKECYSNTESMQFFLYS